MAGRFCLSNPGADLRIYRYGVRYCPYCFIHGWFPRSEDCTNEPGKKFTDRIKTPNPDSPDSYRDRDPKGDFSEYPLCSSSLSQRIHEHHSEVLLKGKKLKSPDVNVRIGGFLCLKTI